MKLRIKLIGTKFKYIPSSVVGGSNQVLINSLISLNVAIIVQVIMNRLSLLPTKLWVRHSYRSMGSFTAAILVIFIAVNNGYHVMGLQIRPVRDPSRGSASLFPAKSNSSSNHSYSSHRTSRQMNFISASLRTMGCVPKFFCGMNSKNPSPSSSTFNDLAYLIKFAMTDEPDDEPDGKEEQPFDEDSGEDIDPQMRTYSEESRENEEIEQLAEDLLINDDPGYLKFARVSGKQKYNGKMDELLEMEAMEAAIAERQRLDDEENETKPKKSKITTLLSGVKNIFRLGRSWKWTPPKRPTRRPKRPIRKKGKAFWESKQFRQQMLLAAKVADSEKSKLEPKQEKDVCSSTFDLCPYTYQQMTRMIRGEPEPLNKTEPKPTELATSSTPLETSIVLNGVTYPVSTLLSQGGRQQPAQTQFVTQPENQIINLLPPNWAVNRVAIPSVLGVTQPQPQPQPIIYVVQPPPEGANFNSTPAPTRKIYSVKSKPSHIFPLKSNPQEANDDDEFTQNWTDSNVKDKNNTVPNEEFSVMQKQQFGNWRNRTRPYKEENYHTFSKIKTPPKPPKNPFRPIVRQPPESPNDSGSDENGKNAEMNPSQQPYRNKFERRRPQEPQNREASQKYQQHRDEDRKDTSSSDEDDDEKEHGRYPVFNVTINRPNKSPFKYPEDRDRPFRNNGNKDTSSSDEDEDNLPPGKFPQNDDKTSEEDESQEQKIVWAERTTTSTTTSTTTTPKPRWRTTPKYKLRPQKEHFKNKKKHQQESDESAEKSSEEERVKLKRKKTSPKRRPSSSSHPHWKGQNNKHQHKNFGKGGTGDDSSEEIKRFKPRKKLSTTKTPPSTTSISPSKYPDEKNEDSDETLEESSEEEKDLVVPPPTIPPTPTTTRKSRPNKVRRPAPPKSPPSTTTPYTEPEYGSLPHIPDLSSEDSKFPSLVGLPVPSPALITTPVPPTTSTTSAPIQQIEKTTTTTSSKKWENNKNNFPYPSFLSLASPTKETIPTVNLISAIAQASKVKKVFGYENNSPFGLLLSNILNSSSTAQVLQGVGTGLPTSSSEEEVEPHLTSHHNPQHDAQGQGHTSPQFWNNFKTQQEHGHKITRPLKHQSNQSVRNPHYQNYEVPAHAHFAQQLPERQPTPRPNPRPRPHSQNRPQRQQYQNVQEMRYPSQEPYQFQPPPFRDPHPERPQYNVDDYQHAGNPYQQQEFPRPQQWSSGPTESWYNPHAQKPFVSSQVTATPIRINVPRRRNRGPFSSREQVRVSSREHARVPSYRPTRPSRPTIGNIRQPYQTQVYQTQNVRRWPNISGRDRVRARPKTPYAYPISNYQKRLGEEPASAVERISDDENTVEQQTDDDDVADRSEASNSSVQATEHEIQIKEEVLNKQRKLQLEFATRLNFLADQQLMLAQQQVFQKPSSKEKNLV